MSTWARNGSGDLLLPVVGSGQSALVTDVKAAAQLIIQDALQFFLGEWAFNTAAGFPWLMWAGQKNPNTATLSSAIRSYVLGLGGVDVVACDPVTVTFNPSTRDLRYSGQATLATGEVVPFGSASSGANPTIPFVPSQLPGCLLWLRSDSGVSLDTSGAVAQWDDLSGNGYNLAQPVPLNRPGYNAFGGPNGRPAVLWPLGNANMRLFGSFLTIPQPFEVFVVANLAAQPVAHNDYLYDFGMDNCSLRVAGGTDLLSMANTPSFGPSATVVPGTPFVAESIWNGASTSIAVDGGTPATGSVGGAGGTGVIYLGNSGAGSQPWEGQLLELVIYAGVFGSAPRSQINNYFRQEWGV